MDTKFQDRLDTLETHIAHQDKQLQELSDIVASQARTIDALTAQIKHVNGKIKAVEDLASAQGKSPDARSVSEIAALEKPPHY